MIIRTEFELGDRVHIDGDESITATICGIEVRGNANYLRYDVNWFYAGGVNNAWFMEQRLTKESQ